MFYVLILDGFSADCGLVVRKSETFDVKLEPIYYQGTLDICLGPVKFACKEDGAIP